MGGWLAWSFSSIIRAWKSRTRPMPAGEPLEGNTSFPTPWRNSKQGSRSPAGNLRPRRGPKPWPRCSIAGVGVGPGSEMPLQSGMYSLIIALRLRLQALIFPPCAAIVIDSATAIGFGEDRDGASFEVRVCGPGFYGAAESARAQVGGEGPRTSSPPVRHTSRFARARRKHASFAERKATVPATHWAGQGSERSDCWQGVEKA